MAACEQCGAVIYGRSDRNYCGATCRQRARRAELRRSRPLLARAADPDTPEEAAAKEAAVATEWAEMQARLKHRGGLQLRRDERWWEGYQEWTGIRAPKR